MLGKLVTVHGFSSSKVLVTFSFVLADANFGMKLIKAKKYIKSISPEFMMKLNF
jgi:hypothetical protein